MALASCKMKNIGAIGFFGFVAFKLPLVDSIADQYVVLLK